MAAGGGSKKNVDIEQLLQWAYLDELPKRQTSSAEGIWDRLAQYGSLGGVDPDPGHGAAQRYAHFGLPHRDAEAIERGVAALGTTTIDWQRDFELIAGDLEALVSINDVGRQRPGPRRVPVSGWTDRKGNMIRVPNPPAPRDVLLVNSINVAALLIMHAVHRSRPDWRTERMRVVPTLAKRGPYAEVVGECKGRNLYTLGSYCPLRWVPSPIEIVLTRADYVAWHHGLRLLAEQLELAEHVALPPKASGAPWIEGEAPGGQTPRTFRHQPVARSSVLPLKPQRPITNAPPKKPRHSKVRTTRFDKGAKA